MKMIRVTSRTVKVTIREQGEVENLISHLSDKGYLPVIRTMFKGMFSLAKLPELDEHLITRILSQRYSPVIREPTEVLGDVFFTDDFIYVLVPGADILQTLVVGEAIRLLCGQYPTYGYRRTTAMLRPVKGVASSQSQASSSIDARDGAYSYGHCAESQAGKALRQNSGD